MKGRLKDPWAIIASLPFAPDVLPTISTLPGKNPQAMTSESLKASFNPTILAPPEPTARIPCPQTTNSLTATATQAPWAAAVPLLVSIPLTTVMTEIVDREAASRRRPACVTA